MLYDLPKLAWKWCCCWTSIYSLPFSREMFPVPLLGQCGPTFARKTNQEEWMIHQCLVSPVNMTYKHAYMATPVGLIFFPSIVHFPPFSFIGLGWCLTFWIQATKPILSGLGSKEIFFLQGPGCFARVQGQEAQPKEGSESHWGPRKPHPPSFFSVRSQMASELNISVCFCFILSALGSPCLWTNGAV